MASASTDNHDNGDVGPPREPEERPKRPTRGIPPVLAGLVLDAVDFATMGPLGLYGGFVLGGLAAGWAARQVGLEGRGVWLAALGGAVYAATPATELIPLGAAIGLVLQLLRR